MFVCVQPVQVSDQEQLLGHLKYLAKEAAERQAGLQARIDRCARGHAPPQVNWVAGASLSGHSRLHSVVLPGATLPSLTCMVGVAC